MKGHWSEPEHLFWIALTPSELNDIVLALDDVDLSQFSDRFVTRINAYRDRLQRLERTKESFDS